MDTILSLILFIGLTEKHSQCLVIYINKCRVPDIAYNRVARLFCYLVYKENFSLGLILLANVSDRQLCYTIGTWFGYLKFHFCEYSSRK